MPTKREREYYRMGFSDGYKAAEGQTTIGPLYSSIERGESRRGLQPFLEDPVTKGFTKKRKLSAWNKFVKNKRNHIKYRTGPDKGKLNLRLMGVAFRRTPAGKKKRR